MRPLFTLALFLWREERTALMRGLILSVTVLVAGVALLGLSGWFIVAASAAGLAGAGISFDVFRPSAGVRFLALGRSAARYGERLLTHDATLRALARLRVQILRRLTHADFPTMVRLRGADLLNRMTADIDALDGLAIRLIFPFLAGGATLGLAFFALWYLVDFGVALFVVAALGLTSCGILIWLSSWTHRYSQAGARSLQLLREGVIDHMRGRGVLAFAGVMDLNLARLFHTDQTARSAQMQVTRQEIAAGAALGLASSLVSAGTLMIGGSLVVFDAIDPARAALALFATLAIFETIAPLRRGIAELGRMRDAAERIAPHAAPVVGTPSQPARRVPANTNQHQLSVERLQVAVGSRVLLAEPISFQLAAGQTLALTGKSGVGKSTVLNTIAGLIAPHSGSVMLDHWPLSELSESELRSAIGYLPQRSALLSGTIRETMTLGATATDRQIAAVVNAVALVDTVAAKGGLDARLGEGGAGLSGGERKRLALSRVLLREPRILLLDEVTEGLDAATARDVLSGIRGCLPRVAIVLAAHRDLETDFADRTVSLRPAAAM